MNITLIGLGMVADTHIAAIADSPELTLHSVWARDADKAQAFAKRASDMLGYSVDVAGDVAAIARDDQVDFVILATPPDARRSILKTLAAGGKPVLMEKPVERTLAAAEDIVTLYEGANLPLGIVFQHRVRAASLALKDAIETGVLGDIATFELRVPWWRDQSYYDAYGRGTYARDGGGVMISQAIHTLDLALWLLGPVARVQAMMRSVSVHRLEAENWAGGLLAFECGAVGTLMATTAAYPGGAESIHLQGAKAAAHLESGVLTLHHLDGRVETIGASATTGGGADPMAFTHAWHQSVIEDFANSLKTGRAPLAPARAALSAHRVIDAMERASASGQTEDISS